MHPISDKELDKLFQQRFEEADFQPSEMLWEKIEGKLDQGKKGKNSMFTLWRVAASILLVAAAALWFYRPVEVIRLQGAGQQAVTNSADNFSPLKEPIKEIRSSTDRSFSYPVAKSPVTMQIPEETVLPEQVAETPVQPAESIASNVPAKKTIITENKDQMKDIKVPPAYRGDQSKLDVTQSDMIASLDAVDEEVVADQDINPSKKIKSIGSLVNFVISKVDRRNDKIIEFKDGMEGSEVSGINLGVLKLKNRIK